MHLIRLLILLESNSGAAQVPRESKKADEVQLSTFAGMEKEEELLQIRNQHSHKPLTSSIMNTFRHLYYNGGILGLFRGAHVFYLHYGLIEALRYVLKLSFGPIAESSKHQNSLLTVAIELAFSPLELMWVWSVLGRSRKQRRPSMALRLPTSIAGITQLFRRIPLPPLPTRSDCLQVLLPLALQQSFVHLTRSFWPEESLVGKHYLKPMRERSRAMVERGDFSQQNQLLLFGSIATVEKVLRGVLWLAIPETHMLILILYASLLPEATETIVRFDRTCGGAVEYHPGRAMPFLKTYKFLSPVKLWRIGRNLVVGGILGVSVLVVCSLAVRSALGLNLLPPQGMLQVT